MALSTARTRLIPSMNDRWQRIDDKFHAALDRPPSERSQFLQQLADEDIDLHRDVVALLHADESAKRFLETPVASLDDTVLAPQPTANPGDRVGGYRLLRLLGEGGMATVFLAERVESEFHQQVAVKMMSTNTRSHEFIQQFARERQLLANLRHPHIAQLIDGGTSSAGTPYLVMEYVEGQPFDIYCKQHDLAVPERIALFRQVCDAVHFAHQNLVVHRDLKCGNILVTESGQVKLLDFGIARMLLPGADDKARRTQTLFPAMTPLYASPEQFLGGPITTATDVYSLGVTLYYLLSDRYPLDLRNDNRNEWERMLRDDTPLRPSLAARDRSFARSQDRPHSPQHGIKKGRVATWESDLDRIVLKALHKEPLRRYASVEQFSDDLSRYLQGLPVRARPDSVRYRLSKFLRRNRLAASLAGIALMSLVLGLVGTVWQAQAVRRESLRSAAFAKDAQKNAAIAERQREIATNALYGLVFGVQEKLWGLPGTQSLRSDLLQTALQGLEQVVKTEEQPRKEDASFVVAHQRIGDIELEFGHAAQAREHFEESLAAAEQILQATPEQTSAKENVATAIERIADVDVNTYRACEKAREGYLRARGLREAVLKQDPHRTVAKCALAAVDVKLGHVAQLLNEADAEETAYHRAFATFDTIPDDERTDKRLCRALAVAYSGMCVGDSLKGHLLRAEEYSDQALKLIKLGMGSTSVSHGTSILMAIHHQRGILDTYLGRFDQAKVEFSQGQTLGEDLLRLDPGNADMRRRVAVFRQRGAEVLLQTEDYSAAEKAFKDVRREYAAIHSAENKSIESGFDGVLVLQNLAEVAARMRDYRQSEAYFAEANDILMLLEREGGMTTPLLREYRDVNPQLLAAAKCLASEKEEGENAMEALGDQGRILYYRCRGIDAAQAGEDAVAKGFADRLLEIATADSIQTTANEARFACAMILASIERRVTIGEDGIAETDVGMQAIGLLELLFSLDPGFLGRVYLEPTLRSITARPDFQRIFLDRIKTNAAL